MPTQSSLVRHRLSRFALAAVLLLSTIVLSSCGDVYRPVANPIIPPGANPQQTFYAIVVGANGPASGSACHRGCFGRYQHWQRRPGREPGTRLAIFDLTGGRGKSGKRLPDFISAEFPVVDHDDRYASCGIGSCIFSAELDQCLCGRLWIEPGGRDFEHAESGNCFCKCRTHPVGVAITPDNAKVFCINQGDGTVSVISTLNNLVVATILVGHNPVRGVMRVGRRVLLCRESGRRYDFGYRHRSAGCHCYAAGWNLA